MSPSSPIDSRPDDQPYQAALKFLYERINYERIVQPTTRYTFRLQQISRLMRRLGLSAYLYEPAQSLTSAAPKVPLVHIAGTKGKGSTAAMVSAALTAAGLRTGLYTSPHLHRLEERFRIDGLPCSAAELVALVDQIAPAVEAVESELGPPSFFELTTALAMLRFDKAECDAIVLEVGLGGRLDSTNVCASSVTAITSIGLDHQHVLGETLVEIAAEKAGIIKTNVPVVSGATDSGAAAVIAACAERHHCDLFTLGTDFDYRSSPAADWGSLFEYHGHRFPLRDRIRTSLPLEGDHQSRNAAIAIAILDLLRDQGIAIPDLVIETSFAQLNCPARIERFSLPHEVTGIVDAAHNRDSIAALCDTLRVRSAHRPVAVVFGTSIDKEARVMLDALGQVADQVVLTRFWGNPRFRPTHELLQLLPEHLHSVTTVLEDPIQACESALRSVTPGGTLVVCGSFFLAAETRAWFAGGRFLPEGQ